MGGKAVSQFRMLVAGGCRINSLAAGAGATLASGWLSETGSLCGAVASSINAWRSTATNLRRPMVVFGNWLTNSHG